MDGFKIVSIAIIIIAITLFIASITVVVVVAKEVDEKGLKHIIEEIWEGEEN